VIRIAATCTVVSDSPTRNSVALMATPSNAYPATRRASARSSFGSFRAMNDMITAAPATRTQANASGDISRIPSLATM
jgi:hypothetical protein